MKKKWYEYLWIASLIYLVLGFLNILFAWLGLLCFFLPLMISVTAGTKAYCNRYCGRGQLFGLLGGRFGLSRRRDIPKWMRSKAFRYGFLIFFFAMFFLMLWNTYLVFAGVENLKQAVTLLWTFKLPWQWAYHGTLFHPRRGAVRLRLLQRNADLHRAGADYHGTVQASKLVRILSNGNHDPADLQSEAYKAIQEGFNVRKKVIPALVLLSLMLTGCASPAPQAGAYRQVTMQEAVEMMEAEEGYIILDVRTEQEFASGHIPGATLLPNESIGTEDPDCLPDKDQLILVYCRSGNRSKQASDKLARLGYTNVVEFGGINSWPGEIETE